jgi:hypothetical protein
MASQDLQSKITRAIRALLISEGAGSTEDTFVEFTSDQRSLPNTTIDSGSATEHIMFTGNWRFTGVNVVLRDAATVQPDETNTQAARIAAQERYDLVRKALTRVGDNGEFTFLPSELTAAGRALAVDESSGSDAESVQRAEDNADMADFTVFWWNITNLSSPRLNTEATAFEADMQFDCIACNGNFS